MGDDRDIAERFLRPLLEDPDLARKVIADLAGRLPPERTIELVAIMSETCDVCGDAEVARWLRACRTYALEYAGSRRRPSARRPGG